MTKVIFILTCAAIFALTLSADVRMGDSGGKEGSPTPMATPTRQESGSIESKDIDIQMVMSQCNDSFMVDMSTLASLNESGSFVDETDKTPKCFIRCLLENTGVMSPDDGMFNPARAAVLFAGERNGKPMDDIADMTAFCATERKETCRCEKAYKFLRCLMSMEIEKYETSQ